MHNIDELDEKKVQVRDNFKGFLLGGKCETTITSNKTGKQYTYYLEKSDKDNEMYFLHVMYEYKKYQYAGLLIVKKDGVKFKRGTRGKLTEDSNSVKAIVWVLNRAVQDKSMDKVKIYHLGRCGVCGRELTDQESIERGIGPVCLRRVQKMRIGKYGVEIGK